MSAWDTTKNTASVSFTDSYGTAILQPSGSDQFAFGFFRNNGNAYGRQYFELHIRDVGGDPTDLHLGFVFGKTPNTPTTPPMTAI